MTKQEVFDRVVTHLLTQNKRSASSYGSCLYKGPEGLRCAVGCLFPDSYDTSKIEGSGCVSRDVVSPLIELGVLTKEDYDCYVAADDDWKLTTTNLLKKLQFIHDNEFTSNWRSELENTAKAHNLTFNPPKSA
jgi:hypothetical protein